MDYLQLDYHRDRQQRDFSSWHRSKATQSTAAREPMDWLNNSRNHRDNDQPWDTAEHRNYSNEF